MPDDVLIGRLDRFVMRMLDEAEGEGCDKAPSGDTSEPSEGGPGPASATATLSERVAVLKACVSYLSLRERQGGGDRPDGDEGKTADREPEIVEFERRLNRKRGARGR